MLRLVSRIICGLVGLFSGLIGVTGVLQPGKLGDQLGVAAQSALGANTIAADFPAFFVTAAIFALLAAVRGSRNLIWVPACLFGLAAVFRMVNILQTSVPDGIDQPLGVELGIFGLLMFANRFMGKR